MHGYGVKIKRLHRHIAKLGSGNGQDPRPRTHIQQALRRSNATGYQLLQTIKSGGMLAGPKAEAGIEHNQFLPRLHLRTDAIGTHENFPAYIERLKMALPGINPILAPQWFDLQLPIADRHTTAFKGLKFAGQLPALSACDALFCGGVYRDDRTALLGMLVDRGRLAKDTFEDNPDRLGGLQRSGQRNLLQGFHQSASIAARCNAANSSTPFLPSASIALS